MTRTLLGGLVAGVLLFVIGFIFWATPLGELPYSTTGAAQNAAVQTALAQNLTESGTGTYMIPAHKDAAGAILYAQGPIATVHFNTLGFSPDDMGMMVPGLIAALVSGLLIALAIGAVSRGRDFPELARLVILFSAGITIWTILAQPIFNHFGWGYWIYSFIAETTALIVAGLVVAKWFVPRERIAESVPVSESAPDSVSEV